MFYSILDLKSCQAAWFPNSPVFEWPTKTSSVLEWCLLYKNTPKMCNIGQKSLTVIFIEEQGNINTTMIRAWLHDTGNIRLA